MRTLSILALLLGSQHASAFCGTYVSPDEPITNHASQLVVARDGDHTTLTMFNDFQGPPESFALVIPFPSSILGDQVRTLDSEWIGKLEQYSAPREVQYSCDDFYRSPAAPMPVRPPPPVDPDDGDTGEPTGDPGSDGGSDDPPPDDDDDGGSGSWGAADTGDWWTEDARDSGMPSYSSGCGAGGSTHAPPPPTEPEPEYEPTSWTDVEHDVEVEDHFQFGEYEAFVLTADGATGLGGWLDANGFVMKPAARDQLTAEVTPQTRFLAVRVDAALVPADGWLSPIQVEYDSPMISLPIRLGAHSSAGVQDLLVYVVTSTGQAVIANYPEIEVESECMRADDAPFAPWYADRLDEALGLVDDPAASQSGAGWLLEYGWWTPPPPPPPPTATFTTTEQTIMAKCDPCADGRDFGQEQQTVTVSEMTAPAPSNATRVPTGPLTAEDMKLYGLADAVRDGFYVTRLHMRYTPDAITQDLMIHETGILRNTQERFVAHSWELESLLPQCGGVEPAHPGRCYTSEYWHRRAEARAEGVDVPEFAAPATGCSTTGRAVFALALPGLILLRRRRS